ncbi:ice-binding family protein [Streptomyces sp. Amel2xB2]|uniref:ice-binding family protein n=1 Tax=Streptomyces sp. Amel2xB2 TaxID=1305829 RepID=UPI0021AC2C2A|nr:ice-binding family protein [Streptomyces sp. Amel2xB2]
MLQWHAIVSWFVAILLIAFGAVALTPSSANAVATAVNLGTADSYGVLGGQSVTNTGPSVVSGDLGVSPGSAISGFPPGTVLGTIHQGDAQAAQAQADLTTAYNSAAGQACDDDLTGQDLGGLTLVPGVYCFDSSAQLTGDLTLDAEGDPNAVWVFQIGSTLTTASASNVNFINGASPCNVFWQVGSSATLGTDTDFVGTIMALTSITLNTGADINGRALARNGSVTMDTNNVDASNCAAATNGGTTDGGTTDGGTTGENGGTTTGGTTGENGGTTTTGGTSTAGGTTTSGGLVSGVTTGGIITGGNTTGASTTTGGTTGANTGGTTGETTGGGKGPGKGKGDHGGKCHEGKGPHGHKGGPPEGHEGEGPHGHKGGPPEGHEGEGPHGHKGGPPEGHEGEGPHGHKGGPPEGHRGDGPPEGDGGPPQCH